MAVVSLRIRSSDAGDKEYITDTLTKHVRRIASILGSTEERVLISVNKYNARFAGSATWNRGQAASSASSSHFGFRPRHLGTSAGGTANVNNSSIDQR